NRLETLVKVVENDFRNPPEKYTPAVVKFYDIAGLVKGASQGEGLGNEFLGHIREVNAIAHVLRDFDDPNVSRAGSVDPDTDREIINTELGLADIQVLEGLISKLKKDARGVSSKEVKLKLSVAEKILKELNDGKTVGEIKLTEEEKKVSKGLNLLSLKPVIYIFNVSEDKLSNEDVQNDLKSGNDNIYICAKLEADLADFDEKERKSYLKEMGIEHSGLDKLIKKGYEILNLHTFFSIGPKEVRAWTISKGSNAYEAAGVIHSDFQRGFISAEVINFNDLKEFKSVKKAKEKGLVRMEGKEYVVKDGDVIMFRFNV
ncbi:redox-regulated ATPase YchF, partial [Patescibacteria group bacterium]